MLRCDPIFHANSNGDFYILFNAQYPDGNGNQASGTFLLTVTSGTNLNLQQVLLPSIVGNCSLDNGIVNAQGIIADIGTLTTTDSNGNFTTSGLKALLLLPVQLSIAFSYAGSGWNPDESELDDPEAIISGKVTLPPGVSGSLNIVQDCNSTLTQTYDNNSWAYCATPGFLADDSTDVWENWTDSQGNLNVTRTDSPFEGSRGLAAYLTKIEDTGTLRDFLTLQIGSSPPQLVAEVDWSFSTAATFKPDPRTTGTNHYPTIHQPPDSIQTVPDVGNTAYGKAPTDSPVPPPRTPTANDYVGSEGDWNLYGP